MDYSKYVNQNDDQNRQQNVVNKGNTSTRKVQNPGANVTKLSRECQFEISNDAVGLRINKLQRINRDIVSPTNLFQPLLDSEYYAKLAILAQPIVLMVNAMASNVDIFNRPKAYAVGSDGKIDRKTPLKDENGKQMYMDSIYDKSVKLTEMICQNSDIQQVLSKLTKAMEETLNDYKEWSSSIKQIEDLHDSRRATPPKGPKGPGGM